MPLTWQRSLGAGMAIESLISQGGHAGLNVGSSPQSFLYEMRISSGCSPAIEVKPPSAIFAPKVVA
mgnify:CR=1 FL=1